MEEKDREEVDGDEFSKGGHFRIIIYGGETDVAVCWKRRKADLMNRSEVGVAPLQESSPHPMGRLDESVPKVA